MTVGTGSLFDVQNLGSVDLASLTTATGGQLGVTIGETATRFTMWRGAATSGRGPRSSSTLDHVGTAAGTYTIIDAATLTGAENLTSSIVTLPFLFTSKLTPDAATARSRSRCN